MRLLRSTKLVQRMAQPSKFGLILSMWIVRPVIKMCPEVVKMRVLDYFIHYSLDLTENKRERYHEIDAKIGSIFLLALIFFF